MTNRIATLAPALVTLALALGATGCQDRVEEERKDVGDARVDLAKVEKKAAEDRAEADREAAEEKAEADRKVAKAKAEVDEEVTEANRAEADKAARVGETMDDRLARFDKRLIEMKADAAKWTGATRSDADRSIVDLEKRRSTIKTDVKELGAKTGAAMDSAKARIEKSVDALEKDLDTAWDRAKASVKKG